MPRSCTVCDSRHAGTVNALVAVGGRSDQSIAAEFGLDRQAVGRHRRLHLHRSDGRARRSSPSAVASLSGGSGAPESGSDAAAESVIDVFRASLSHEPLDWQREFLEDYSPGVVVLKGRQIGASTAASILAVAVARSRPGADAVIVSPSQRQSSEITQKCRLACWELGEKLRADSAGMVQLENGSRIISLPGVARGIRGYAPALVIADEAAWIADETWDAMRPLVAASGGRLVVLSTPGRPIGWFYELATAVPDGWRRMVVPSTSVPTIAPEFLDRERRQMKPHVFAAEYLATFMPLDAVARAPWFTAEEFDARLDGRFAATPLPPSLADLET